MDGKHVVLHIMTDLKNSRSSIAANFQNAIAAQLLPPIGVFWDIENIQVPKGKSASALVNCIRERFFKRHREAEFMCVCDINKENKSIIHDLNDAQVTVVHIDATSKNAADEKLRQCMRRFVDTHGSPATLLLISDDVNFAGDLSDFRHRHHIRIVLIHRNHAPEPLLACANEHYNFSELTTDLPWRSPQKVLNNRPRDLIITGLPTNTSCAHIKKCLARLSDNCGGKVLSVLKTKAAISFANADAAERAQKRIDKQLVYGQRVTVNFLHPDTADYRDLVVNCSRSRRGTSCSSGGSSRDSSPHSSDEKPKKSLSSFAFPAPPVLDARNMPTVLRGPLPDTNREETKTQRHTWWEDIKVPNRVEESNWTSYQNNLSKAAEVVSFPVFPSNCPVTPTVLPQVSRSELVLGREFSTPVELFVTNLDQNIEINEMKKVLQCIFREHVMVLHISMQLQPDGNPKAVVKVPSVQHAQYAISQLQRRKIGHKRILISHSVNDRNPPFAILKSEVVSLLKDIPLKRLPLFKFREMYEKRYNRAISVSELNKMRDVVHIQDEAGARMVSLTTDRHLNTPSPTDSDSNYSQELAILEKPYCERHFCPMQCQGWAEQQGVAPLPDIFMSLKTLAPAVHTLLDSHQGSLPLNSFCACYESDIGPMPIVQTGCEDSLMQLGDLSVSCDGRTSQQQSHGIHLEHLISCISGIEIIKSRLCIKKIQWCENKTLNQTSAVRSISPALAGPLASFGREVTDLLRNQPRCLILFNKFIPVYHHHFGRQCRVADYGFTKLIDLLEAIPHIIQVLGEGQNRLVTLTHRVQVKRFVADLLRILKSRASKQLNLSEFPQLFEESTERQFDILNYGVCDIQDMLSEISENTIIVTRVDEETVIAIPKREQTQEEIERTKVFAGQVVELLKHTPTCSMLFNKFIPAYHHHFGKQCRVADFGFSKLIELFEAIPILEVTGSGEDKILNLADKERNEILSDRLVSVLTMQQDKMMPVNMLGPAYVETYGHVLRPQEFGAQDMVDLLRKFTHLMKVLDSYSVPIVALVDSDFVRLSCCRIVRLLMEQRDGRLGLEDLRFMYKKRFGYAIDATLFQADLDKVAEIDYREIRLSSLFILARNIILLLQSYRGSMQVGELERAYFDRYRLELLPAKHGFPGVLTLLSFFKDFFVLSKKRKKSYVQLTQELIASPLPNEGNSSPVVRNLMSLYKNGTSHGESNSQDGQPTSGCIPSPLTSEAEAADFIPFHNQTSPYKSPCKSYEENVPLPHNLVNGVVASSSKMFGHPRLGLRDSTNEEDVASLRTTNQVLEVPQDSPSPSKIVKLLPMEGTLANRKGGSCRLAAFFSNPLEP